MMRRPPRSTQSRSSAASDVYKRQVTSQASAEETTKAPETTAKAPETTEQAAEAKEVYHMLQGTVTKVTACLLYTSPSPRD